MSCVFHEMRIGYTDGIRKWETLYSTRAKILDWFPDYRDNTEYGRHFSYVE